MQTLTEVEASTPSAGATRPLAKRPSWLAAIFDSELARLAGLVALYSFLAVLFIRAFYISDPDIWWHLRTGDWILAHHAVPRTDPFSSYGMGKPWIAYSWLFEILIQLSYRTFGYVGVVLYEVLIRLALSVALFHLVRSLLPHFWRAVALTGFSLY